MLVLSRLKDEKIIIYTKDKNKITILCTVILTEVRGDKVKLGFEADKHIIIHREEVFNDIVKDN